MAKELVAMLLAGGKVTDMYKSWFCFGIMCGKP